MTGFGKSEINIGGMRYSIDIKSLNSKNIDLNVRLPQWMRPNEAEIRKIISDTMQRGKIDVYINHEILDDSGPVSLNIQLLKSYMQQMQQVSPDLSLEARFQAAMQLPDLIQVRQNEFTENEWNSFHEAVLQAVHNAIQFRNDEGRVLEIELIARIKIIQELLQQVPQFEKERITRLRERILRSLQEIQDVDQDRFEQELIFYLEKLDITEEKVRLENHLEYFLSTMKEKISNGKKLSFITQEIGREINTLGSKSNHAELQKIVVEMKDELEKIKEQILNVL